MRGERVTLVCEWCKSEFETIPSHADRRRYCSVECANHGRRRECESKRRCPECSRLFVVQRWDPQEACSKACADKLKVKRIAKRCELCGQEYETHWCRRKTSRYCSIECLARAKRKVRQRPTKKQLVHLLVHHTLAAIGKMYGVQPNAVRFWCKQYGLRWPDKKERTRLQRLKPRERDDLAAYLSETC